MVVLLAACGGGTEAPLGRTTPSTKRPPIELGIRTTSGDWLEIGSLRGGKVLLFVFATFDPGSQAALRPLARFIETHPEFTVVGVAAQAHAGGLVDAWAYALSPPFVVGADPTGSVEEGTSRLGIIEGVPTYVVLDKKGFERKRVDGYQTVNALEALVSSK